MHPQVHNSVGSFNVEKRETTAHLTETSPAMRERRGLYRQTFWSGCILGLLLVAVFFPAVLGTRTLLASAWSAPSVMPSGAFHEALIPRHESFSPDPGAPAWTLEPWVKVVAEQYLGEKRLPLWNPYSAYGTPFAAAMQPQPFFPLTALLSLHPTPWTYNIFIIARLFIAGILAFLFARQFLGQAEAVFASIAFTLNGYFVIFLDMPHLSVEVLLPGLFLTFELLLRRPSWPRLVTAAAMVCLCICGGMPESAFSAISFACLYVVFRLLLSPEFRNGFKVRAGFFALALLLGFALSAFLLIPFAEFTNYGHDVHQSVNLQGGVSGLVYDGDWHHVITYFFPFLAGAPLMTMFGDSWGELLGYWGVLASLFAIVGILSIFRKSTFGSSPGKGLALFFSAAAAVILLKRFGSPLVNWIGFLPIARLVLFVKYEEPLLAFSIAMLAALGLSLTLKSQRGLLFLGAATVIALLMLLATVSWFRPIVTPHIALSFYTAMVIGAGVILLPIALCALVSPRFPHPHWLQWTFVGLLSAELFCNFILPNFYLSNALASSMFDPYKGAPYVDFIRARNLDNYRVFGRQTILYPNWAGAFGLPDVRALDALYYRRYIAFIRNFLLRGDDRTRVHGELADRFTGAGDGYAYPLDSAVEQRFLALSSVKYILSGPELFSPPDPVKTKLQKIYDKEIVIYEFSQPVPRASLFFAASTLPDEAVLEKLKEPDFNPLDRVILSAESLSPESASVVNSLSDGSARPASAASIVSYDSQRVRIETQTSTPAILLLNDANYPGWRAVVNGRPAEILTANYLFRGVIVPAGHANVEFEYAPASFRLGAAISLASLLVLAAPLIVLGMRRRDVSRESKVPVSRRHALTVSSEGSHNMNAVDQLPIVIRQKDGKVLASIPQLKIYAKAANIDAALAALSAKKAAFVSEVEEFGELEALEAYPLLTTGGINVVNVAGDLRQFAVKTGIVAVAIAAVLVVAGVLIASSASNALGPLKDLSRGGSDFWGKIERDLDRMASPENDLPPAKKEKLLADIHAIGVKWRPFMVELRSALMPPDDGAERPSGQTPRK
jgi:Bacterial membrane protein YfhO